MRELRKYFYTYRDIAKLRGVTPSAVLNAIRRNSLQPNNFENVVKYCDIKPKELKIEMRSIYKDKEYALGIDLSEFLNEKKELTESYVKGKLEVLSFSVIRTLVAKQSCPIILNK